MKNHVMVDGRLLQTNKKWSALKNSQKEKIANWLRAVTEEYYLQYGEYPFEDHAMEIVDKVYDQIEEAGIWIPYDEVYDYYNGKRKHFIKLIEKHREKEGLQNEPSGNEIYRN